MYIVCSHETTSAYIRVSFFLVDGLDIFDQIRKASTLESAT